MPTSGLFQQLMDQYKASQAVDPEEQALQEHLAKLRSGLYDKVEGPSTKEALFKGLTLLAPMLAAGIVGGTQAGAAPGIEGSRLLQAQYKADDAKNEERVMKGRLAEIESGTQALGKYKDRRKSSADALKFSTTAGTAIGGLTERQRHNLEMEKNAAARLAKQGAGKLDGMKGTKGTEAADKAFGKDYAEWAAGGGYSNIKADIDKLRTHVAEKLDPKDTSNRPFMGTIERSDIGGSVFSPKRAALKDNLSSVVQKSLRKILGAQFTEKEGERLIQRAFNTNLSDAENFARVNIMLDQLETMAAEKEAATKYFEEKGTLEGYQSGVGVLGGSSLKNPDEMTEEELRKELGR